MQRTLLTTLAILILVLGTYPALNRTTMAEETFSSAFSAQNTVLQSIPQIQIPPTRTVTVTAYTSTPEETDDTPFITASNTLVRDGVIAANFLPFGTKVIIPSLFGDKIFVVEDRMNPKKKNFIDIWMPSKYDAIQFGIRRAEIAILTIPARAIQSTLALNK